MGYGNFPACCSESDVLLLPLCLDFQARDLTRYFLIHFFHGHTKSIFPTFLEPDNLRRLGSRKWTRNNYGGRDKPYFPLDSAEKVRLIQFPNESSAGSRKTIGLLEPLSDWSQNCKKIGEQLIKLYPQRSI